MFIERMERAEEALSIFVCMLVFLAKEVLFIFLLLYFYEEVFIISDSYNNCGFNAFSVFCNDTDFSQRK